MTELDPETKARIEAEERYRAGVRSGLEQDQLQSARPGYWGGFLLNLLVIGVGLFVISQPLSAVVWLLLALILVPISGFWLWPVFAVGVLMHYNIAYHAKYD
jgi:hypothetical protein